MKKLIFFSLIICSGLSCKKSTDKTCNLDTASVAGSYKVTAVRYKATATSSETDYYSQFFPDACERDDIITLNANGSATFTDAGIKCSHPGDDVSTSSPSGNTITIDGGPAHVDSFNCNSITISEADVFAAGDKLIIVLTRQ